MKLRILVFLVSISASFARAQAPDTLWTRTYGGEFNDAGNSVDITFDGDYIIAGETFSLEGGSYDIYLIKIDPYGDTVWTKTFGGIQSEYGNSVIQTSDSGYAIVGETRSYGVGSYDVYLIKTDSNGDTLWTRTYGGGDYEKGNSIFQTSDGGYIITGSTKSFGAGAEDVYLIRTDSMGDTVWTETIGGSQYDQGYSVLETAGGEFVIAGNTESFGMGLLDGYVIKTDAYGDTLWTKTIGGGEIDGIRSMRITSDGKYILAGYTSSYGAGITDGYLIKLNESGDTLWTKTYGGAGNDHLYSLQQTADGGYILAGRIGSPGPPLIDAYVIKVDSLGDMVWSSVYGGPGQDIANSVRQTSDGGYIIAGMTSSYGAGNSDVYIIRLRSGQTLVEDNDPASTPRDFVLSPNYPNPFNASTTISFELTAPGNIKLTVYDILGREIYILADGYLEAGEYNYNFVASNLSSGIYFCRLDDGTVVRQRRMVLLK